MLRNLCGITVVAAAFGVSADAGGAPAFKSLEDSQGVPFTTACGVSADGTVVVGYGNAPGEPNEAVVWTEATGAFKIGEADSAQAALDVSADGQVAVGRTSADDGDMAFRWSWTAGFEGLNYLPGHNRSAAYGVSADGAVIVGESRPHPADTTAVEAFRWTQNGMDSVASNAYASAVSDDGSVVVGTMDGAAFRWTASTDPVDLPALPGGGVSYGRDCSGNGSVAVGYGTSATGTQAFRWTVAGGTVGLGYLPGGSRSEAHAISADGSVVVGSAHSAEGEVAFIWDAEHGMRPLLDVLVQDCGLDMTGWKLFRAYDVSGDGTVIVGTGPDPSNRYVAWKATIPEPATLGLLAFGGLAVVRRRKRL